MIRALRAAVLAGVLVVTAASALAAPLRPADVRGGRVLAERNCGRCHATGEMGSSPNVAAPPFRSLGRHYPMDMLEYELRAGMLTGHPDMPAYRFAPPEIDDLIAYLKSLQIGRRAEAAPSPEASPGASPISR